MIRAKLPGPKPPLSYGDLSLRDFARATRQPLPSRALWFVFGGGVGLVLGVWLAVAVRVFWGDA